MAAVIPRQQLQIKQSLKGWEMWWSRVTALLLILKAAVVCN